MSKESAPREALRAAATGRDFGPGPGQAASVRPQGSASPLLCRAGAPAFLLPFPTGADTGPTVEPAGRSRS